MRHTKITFNKMNITKWIINLESHFRQKFSIWFYVWEIIHMDLHHVYFYHTLKLESLAWCLTWKHVCNHVGGQGYRHSMPHSFSEYSLCEAHLNSSSRRRPVSVHFHSTFHFRYNWFQSLAAVCKRLSLKRMLNACGSSPSSVHS